MGVKPEGRPPLGGRQDNARQSAEPPAVREKGEDSPVRQRGDHGDRRGRRPRPNQPGPEEEPERKRKKPSQEREGVENEDELLGLCVRGGSPDGDAPIWKPKATGHVDTGWMEDEDDNRKRRRMNSPGGKRGSGGFRAVTREERDARARLQMKRKMKPQRKGVADKEVCINYLKGACTKGADCFYSHNVCQPRKMELCKFYLKDCCMKRDKCLYLHEEFPCKFFHTGLKCYANKKCKFSHDPLNNFTREVLLKHMETAPKDILGDFPRMSRENAEAAVGGGGGGRFQGHDDRPEGSFTEDREFGGRRDRRDEEERGPFGEAGDFGGRRNRRDDGPDQRGPSVEERDFGGRRDRRDEGPDQRGPFGENSEQQGPGENFDQTDNRNDNINRGSRRHEGDDVFTPERNENENRSPGRPSETPDFPETRGKSADHLEESGFQGGNWRGDEPKNFQNRRDDGDQRREEEFGEGANPFESNSGGRRRGERQSPDVGNRFGRGPRGRDGRGHHGDRRRGGNDHRGHGNRGEDRHDGEGRNFGRNFGPNSREGRNFNAGGPNRQGRNFNFDVPGPGGQGFNPDEPRGSFDPESPRKRGFAPDGPGDGRFGPSDQRRDSPGDGRFGPSDQRRDGPGDGRFGPSDQRRDGPGDGRFGSSDQRRDGPGDGRFGPSDQRRDDPDDGRFGPNDQRHNRGRNFGPDGPNHQNFGPNNFGPGGPNNPNFGPGGGPGVGNFGPNMPNFGPAGPNFGFGANNFGPNGPNFGANEPEDFRHGNFNPDGPDDRRFEASGPQDQWPDSRGRSDGPDKGDRRIRGGRKHRNRGPPGDHENDGDDHRQLGNQTPGGGLGDHRRERGPRNSSGNETGEPDAPQHQKVSPRQLKPLFPQVEDDSNNSGTSSPFDFAKELAEYKNKKMEMEMLKRQQEEAEASIVIEKGPELIPRQERMEEDVRHPEPEPPECFPPPFTQVYPPFPTEEEKPKEKKEASSKRHHHKKKKKHSELDEEERRKSRKERKEKKRQPVIVTEDGSFGGIKFKIKLNPGKDDKREVTSHRRPSEFMSSDDEIPLNCLQKRKDKEDGDETDTESRLVIETNEEPEEKSSPHFERAVEQPPQYPRHLPRKQQELFMRIQSHQSQIVADEVSRRSGSPGDRTPTPEPADENWYSSDDDAATGPPPQAPVLHIPRPTPVESRQDPSAAASKIPERPELESRDIPLPERSTTPPGPPPAPVQPTIELAALKDLSKINITELLSSIRQITGNKAQASQDYQQPSVPSPSQHEKDKKDPRARDPRQGPASPKETKARRGSGEEKPPYAKSIYDVTTVPGSETKKDLDLRFRLDVDERSKEASTSVAPSAPAAGGFGDVDLRILGDGPLPALKLDLPFKTVLMHTAATEIEASLTSHPPMDYKVTPIHVPPPDFSHIKISPSDPMVKKDPRLRRLFRVSSVEEPKPEEPKKPPTARVDPRRRGKEDTPKSPPDTPFSPPQEVTPHPEPTTPRLTPNLLALVQLGLSAATGGAAFDPRLRSLVPQDLEALRAVVSGLRPEDIETIRSMDVPQGPQGPPELRGPGQGLLPTPPVAGMGLLPTPPTFMMNSMMPMDPMMGPMGPMGQRMPGPMGPMAPMGGPMNQAMGGPMGPFGFEPPIGNDSDMRMYRGGFKGERRGGRGNWRGGSRDRNWDSRRHRDRHRDNWDEGRNRDKDDRRERRSYSPTE